ncbi:hypothetical protein ABOM_001631, partial [Aspergillus bombycis]
MHSLAIRSLFAGLLVSPFLLTAAGESQNASTPYPELYAVHSDSTPVFQNITGKTANPLVHVLQGAGVDRVLEKRDNGLPIGTCAPGFGGCGPAVKPSCDGQSATQRTVGYYEGWAATRVCDKQLPSDLDVSGLTHINFAFAYFHPSSFEILPMSEEDMALYPKFTALKERKPYVFIWPTPTLIASSLKAWISIGGWAFNDATNAPNTQTAFSDMAGSAAGRQKFAQSLINFMATWGFDGVDLDWEYPGADDRGGITADTANFVLLLKDLKEAFGGQYGLRPYVRPHTNLTEIHLGLDLLWRNNVDPSMVNMGIGWYGRSFTLQDPQCNKPGCIFSYGGKAGECTKSSGTLSNAEIQRIISKDNIVPTVDREAGVKWITFDYDQWVSYDDGETMQIKMDVANQLCLGGTLIWSLDQDSLTHTSSNDLAGLGLANGVSAEEAALAKEILKQAGRTVIVRNTCHWSACGEDCGPGYFAQTYAKGQSVGIRRETACPGDEVKTLCCATGTKIGTCSWHGWRGVGGLGAIPGMMAGSLLSFIIGNICPKSDSTGSSEEYAGMIANTIGQGALGPNGRDTRGVPKIEINLSPKKPPQGKPRQRLPVRGRYTMAQYKKKKDKDCSVTYTCEYGHGYDEVCDNQRCAIDKGLGGKTIYHKHEGPRPGETEKDNWSLLDRRREYYTLANAKPSPNSRGRCNASDEFPMAALEEGIDGNYKVVRLINGIANGKQAQAMVGICLGLPPPPPITWAFGAFPEGDDRASGFEEHFIKAYGRKPVLGYVELSALSLITSPVPVQLHPTALIWFRAKLDDPMFNPPYNWPTFNHYNKPPSSPDNLPKNVFDSQWWKREVARSVLQRDLPMSAIYEAEKISLARDAQSKAQSSTLTAAVVDLSYENDLESQRPSLNDILAET